MGNYGISINLQALHGACLRTLKGKDGQEIYEGDLLLSVGMVWEVVYDENRVLFVLCTEYGRGSTPLGEMIRSFYFKIGGNIHDNPELLEEGK